MSASAAALEVVLATRPASRHDLIRLRTGTYPSPDTVRGLRGRQAARKNSVRPPRPHPRRVPAASKLPARETWASG